MNLKTFILAATALTCAVPAFAADFPQKTSVFAPAPTSSWAGFYAGVNGGYAATTGDQTLRGIDPNGTAAVGAGIVPSSLNDRAAGALAGATLGYNWQSGPFVYGLETDLDWADVKGSHQYVFSAAPTNITTSNSERLRWLDTARARLGYAIMPDTLIYATGGAAAGGVKDSTALAVGVGSATVASAVEPSSKVKFGWTVGGGVEQRLGQGWSVKAEYLFVDLGSATSNVGGAVGAVPANFATKQTFDLQTVRLGLNYRF